MQPKSISKIISLLKHLPGVGHKTAERFTYHILNNPDLLSGLISSFTELKDNIVKCVLCNNYADTSPCSTCSDETRDKTLLCVIEHPQEVYVIESTKSYSGLYYILDSIIEPLEGKMPKDMNLSPLVKRIKETSVKELILATDLDTEGEFTADYIVEFLISSGIKDIKFSRLARGLPSGAEIEYADPATLLFALKNRIEIKK